MPRAGDLPIFAFSTHNVPSTANPPGVKGAGRLARSARAGSHQCCGRRALPSYRITPYRYACNARRVWEMLNGKQ
jgi:hypothetical protein